MHYEAYFIVIIIISHIIMYRCAAGRRLLSQWGPSGGFPSATSLGTITDDYFEDNDAHVVCRSLGYGDGAAGEMCCSQYGQGTDQSTWIMLGATGMKRVSLTARMTHQAAIIITKIRVWDVKVSWILSKHLHMQIKLLQLPLIVNYGKQW